MSTESEDLQKVEMNIETREEEERYVPAGLENSGFKIPINYGNNQYRDYYQQEEVKSLAENDNQPKVYADISSPVTKIITEGDSRNDVTHPPPEAAATTSMKEVPNVGMPLAPLNPQFPQMPVPTYQRMPIQAAPARLQPYPPTFYPHRPPLHPFYNGLSTPNYPFRPMLPNQVYPVKFPPVIQHGTGFNPHPPGAYPLTPIALAANRGPGMYTMMVNGQMQQIVYSRPTDPHSLQIQRKIVKLQRNEALEIKKLEMAKKKEERAQQLEKAKLEKEERRKAAKLAKMEERDRKKLMSLLRKPNKMREKERQKQIEEESSSRRFMAFPKDTFVIRLRDLDSFDRNNEIWRIDNHVLIQKFTGVPSLRAPARQFQSTNRMSGYDMRAVWRFFVINPDNIEFDRYSSEITIHFFPRIEELREAKAVAIEKDEEFKHVELDELNRKVAELKNKKVKRREEKLAKRFEKMKRRAANMRMYDFGDENGGRHHRRQTRKVSTAYKLPNRFKKGYPSRKVKVESLEELGDAANGVEGESVEEICRDVLYSIIDAVVEHNGEEENSSDETDSATDSDGTRYDLDLNSIGSEKEYFDEEEEGDKNEIVDEEEEGEGEEEDEQMDYYNGCQGYGCNEIFEEGEVPDVALELTIEN